MFINGMPVLVSDNATQPGAEVRRHPIRKRRRNWMVVKVTKPVCYVIADSYLLMHPDLYFRLKSAADR